jgi:hypothetical protein
MRKLLLLLLFAAFVLSAKEAVADCVCYGTNWNNSFEYATVDCIQTDAPCYHPGDDDLNDRIWELIPYGEWPAGLTEEACDTNICDSCGNVSYDCSQVELVMRRRYVGLIEGC